MEMKAFAAILFSLLLGWSSIVPVAPLAPDECCSPCACVVCSCIKEFTPESAPAAPPPATSRTQMQAVQARCGISVGLPESGESPLIPGSVAVYVSVDLPLYLRYCALVI